MRLGFIGGYGHHYLRGALTDPAFPIDRPIAFTPSDPHDDRAAVIAKQLGNDDVTFFDDARAMLDEYKPDVVSIGAIYALNGDHAAAALERGIAVVSDKPIAATWQQLERLRALVRAKPASVLLTEFDFRARRCFRAARQAVRDGRIGPPVLATAQKSYRFAARPDWYADRAQYGGTMLWVASHAIDAIRFVTERNVVAITGRNGNVSRPQFGTMEEYVTATMELEGGGTGIVHADYYRPDKATTHGDDRLRVAGPKGIVEVLAGRCLLLGDDGAETEITESVQTKPMHAELIAAIRGEATDLFSTAASLDIAALLLHARDAADKQAWVLCQ
ncbi:MAG: Gfo/Idh/MocA family oxidoreductase [Tepidisphaeraceae bacterium]